MIAHAARRAAASSPLHSLLSLFRQFQPRGTDGLTDRERRALAQEWRELEANPVCARDYVREVRRRSSISGF